MQRYLIFRFTPPYKLIKHKITIFHYKYTIAVIFFIKCIKKNSKFISFMGNSQNDELITIAEKMNAPPKERDLFE